MGADLAKIEIGQRAEGLDVHFLAVTPPVEPTSHEVGPSCFFEQSAFHHFDTGSAGHEVIAVFNATEECA